MTMLAKNKYKERRVAPLRLKKDGYEVGGEKGVV
jgi:hypothetical protein